MKDSFYMFHGWYEFIKSMSAEQVKELMVAIYEHELSDGTVDIEVSAEVLPIYAFCKRTLDKLRDAYNRKCEQAAESGRLGGLAKAENMKQTVANGSKRYKNVANLADTDTVTDTETDTDIDTDTDTDTDTELKNSVCNNTLMSGKPDGRVVEIVDYLNLVLGTHYKVNGKKTGSLIRSRLKEGYTVEDFKQVITKKHAEWAGTEREKYLRPETLFCADHFEGYLNQVFVKEERKKGPVETAREEWAEWLRQQEQEQQQQEGGDYIDADGVCEADDDSIGFLPEFD